MAHRTVIMVKRTYLHVAVVTLVTAVLWLIISIYQSLIAPTAVKVDPVISAPITPQFDEEVFRALTSRNDLQTLSFTEPVASPNPVTINEIVPVEGEELATETAPVVEVETTEPTTDEEGVENDQSPQGVTP